MQQPKLITPEEIQGKMDGALSDEIIVRTRDVPEDVLTDIAQALIMLGRYNTTRATILDFDSCMYLTKPRGMSDDAGKYYLAFRSTRTGKSQAGIDPTGGAIKHLATAQILVQLDEIEDKKAVNESAETPNRVTG